MKVVFIGHPGSGKTYASDVLSENTKIDKIDIDNLLHNLNYFLFKASYRKELNRILENKDSWIIDGYGGSRMPRSIWEQADTIIFINLPKNELRRNVYSRYKLKKANQDKTHGQELFVNVIKNLWQIYVLDLFLNKRIARMKQSPVGEKIITINSRHQLDALLSKLVS